MKRTYSYSLTLLAAAFLSSLVSFGQSPVEAVLRQVELNNPSLKASLAGVEAEKYSNKAYGLLENPEVEFNYLWGAENVGNRHDVRVSQPFDIPTLTGMKAKQVSGLDTLSTLKYRAERLDILLKAKQDCIDLVWCNAMSNELSTHLSQAKSLVESYEKRMKSGEATVLDLNKAKLHLANVQGKISKVEIERQSLLSDLRVLNGGKDVEFGASEYDISDGLPSDFESWFEGASARNPVLDYVRQEVKVGKRQLSIDRTSWLPKLSVGYMSEIRTVEKFRGVTLGIGIPLWSNANKVRQARANVAAADLRRADAEQQFYYQLLSKYSQASSLKSNSEMLRASLMDTDNREYLLSAQSKGEISILDYLVGVDMYYDALEQTLAAERDYHKTLADLNAVEL